ncbi:YeaH/YhbH family protein [Candidatus Methylobacter favarea]|uniref:YeaH/YhbH family protein n=1 Tax=Candidatus Methylobacter favarea TaxID=2707345 RepID=UPI00157C241C|nr:YeaH/YhbH family protein [Candidatus Methylobacter favarea]
MVQIVDRRLNGKNKSAVNRQKFIHRFRSQIKKAVADAVNKRSVTDLDKGEKVSIPAKDTSEPFFHHGRGGYRERVHPGNKEFQQGDKIARPDEGSGRGSKASDSGEGQDEFIFELTREEFLNFFFEDLALPNLVKTKLAAVNETKKVRAGHTSTGVPTNINVIRSLRNALGRRIALRGPYMDSLIEAEKQLEDLLKRYLETDNVVMIVRKEIEQLKEKIARIPFIDTFDLRYDNRIDRPKPITQAVMFCIMDISGSMGPEKKDIAKRFFMLLYLFLIKTYEKIQVVFISHHTEAHEVDEDTFFYSRETGGTVVSSALNLMSAIIQERFPTSQWNIYAAQASDGDNWDNDSKQCTKILAEQIMPYVQYYAYTEITEGRHQNLWHEYLTVKHQWDNFAMQRIEALTDIYPVFRKLFEKKNA